MAEALGFIANLAAVVGAGLALSTMLYDFASVLGSASGDVKSLATDIGLFCSVLKHVESTLTRGKAFRLSLSAIQTAEDVIAQCQIIFGELKVTIDKLQKGDSQLDIVTRVKWFFKEKRVLLVREQLKTCGATLHLMLTTLVLAQKIATKRLSSYDEDVQDRLMTHTLFMAQQAASERLAVIEDELMYEETGYLIKSPAIQDALSASQTEILPDIESPRQRRNLSSYKIDGSIPGSVDVNTASQGETKRVSTMLAHHINRLSIVDAVGGSHPPSLDDRRLSILQTDELLRNWTDQCDPLASTNERSEDRGIASALAKIDESESDALHGPKEHPAIGEFSKTANNNVGGGNFSLVEEQENRLRVIEKHLHAEKQLTSTLEEALVDLETQSSKNRVDAESWKKKAWAMEEELARLKKERGPESLSIQAVEEEMMKRREAEAARRQLEERMKLLTMYRDGTAKKRKGGDWFG